MITRNRFLEIAGYLAAGALGTWGISSWLKSQPKQVTTQQPLLPVIPPSPTVVGVTPILTPGKPPKVLRIFSFATVVVNNTGKIIKTEKKNGEYFTLDLGGGVAMDFVAIPGGSFIMGSPSTEKGREKDEGPQRKVTLKPFFMSKYPVTQEQYQQIRGQNPSRFKGQSNLPVENVSWDDAVKFCNILSDKTGQTFTLPSEAQWEYACRAGTTTPFSFGPTIIPELANYDASEIYGSEVKGLNRQKTTPVGTFPANPFGLYDMHGNVWEWCLDGYQDSYKGVPSDGSPWLDDNTIKILRGGSWNYFSKSCRSAERLWDYREVLIIDIGFRPVCLVG